MPRMGSPNPRNDARKVGPLASHTAKKTRETYLGSSRRSHPRHSASSWRIRHRLLRIIACVVTAALVFVGTVAAQFLNFPAGSTVVATNGIAFALFSIPGRLKKKA